MTHRISYARPGKLLTANQVIFKRVVGTLSMEKIEEIQRAVMQLIETGES